MKNFGELVSEVRQEPTALEEGKKPNSMGPGWMLKADPKLGKAVADAVAKAKEKRRLVGSKTEPVKEDVEQLDEMPGANMDTRAVHQHLKKQGWKLTRTSGSHDVFTHPEAKHHIPVPRHRQLKAPLVKGILKQASVNEETDTTEKTEMAQTQLHFIKYAAEEILEYIEMGGEIEEWYQNKLSKVQSEVESLHSYVEGEARRTGMKEEVVAEGAVPAKEKVITVRHKDSGKEIRVVATAAEKYKSLGYEHVKEEVDPAHKKILDKAKTSTPKTPKGEYDRKVEKYLKKKYTKEEVEQINEISDKTLQSYRAKAHTQIQHYKHAGGKDKPEASSVLAKREPGMAKATAKVIQKNKERIAALPKREPQKISSYKSLGGRDDNSGRSYSESVVEEVGQTSNSNENPNAGRFSSGPAKKPMKPTPIVTSEQTASKLGEPKTDVPFDGPYAQKTTKVVKDKSGAVHTPMSRVKHLAKMAARKQAGLKEEEEKEDSYEKTNTPAKRSLSKNAGMVKDLAKNGKSSKKAAPEAFQSEPELSSQIVKV